MSEPEKLPPLTVKISRDIPLPWFVLTLPDGSSEELDPDDCREWFRLRGANMDAIEKALDYVYNFGNYKPVEVVIKNPRRITPLNKRIDPVIGII